MADSLPADYPRVYRLSIHSIRKSRSHLDLPAVHLPYQKVRVYRLSILPIEKNTSLPAVHPIEKIHLTWKIENTPLS
jgi:hypothetical protein